MIKRLDKWFEISTKSATGLFLTPVIIGLTIIGKTYWVAVLASLAFVMEVYSLWRYVTIVSVSEDEEAKICVEKDAFGNEHYLIRNYDENGEIIGSTDEIEGEQDE